MLFRSMVALVPDETASALLHAASMPHDTPAERLMARVNAMLRLRTLHATVLSRAQMLKAERNIIADMPDGDPIDDATVLLIGRGRHHPTLSTAVGERMGVMGALSIDAGAHCLNAREVDGIIIGDGLPLGSAEAFMTIVAKDARFRDIPVGVLGDGIDAPMLPQMTSARDPKVLLQRVLPLIRLRAFETALKRLLRSIESKGMIDPRTGLHNIEAFGNSLSRAIEDSGERGVGLSLARFALEPGNDPRVSVDAARLVSQLVRGADFASRLPDGSILFAFADTSLRSAHVAARRLASVLKHTMLRSGGRQPVASPSVTLATLKPRDTLHTLVARVAPRPVAAA